MNGVVAINGIITSVEDAMIPVTDRGFLYGDNVYEVIRTYNGRPFALKEHLLRLSRSAAMVCIPLPLSIEDQMKEIASTLDAAGGGEWYIRIILSRGGGQIGLDPALADRPRRVIIVIELPIIPEKLRQSGVSVKLVPTGISTESPTPSGAKTGNYLNNIMALRQARAEGGFEAIMIDGQGRIAEGTSSNVFAVKNGALKTPPIAAGILDGITRRKVIELARHAGYSVEQEHLHPSDIFDADELFLTGTLKEILPITRVDGVKVGAGVPGATTLKLRELYLKSTTETKPGSP